MRQTGASYRTASERLLVETYGRKENNRRRHLSLRRKFRSGHRGVRPDGGHGAAQRAKEVRVRNKTAGPRLQGPPGEQLFIVNGNKIRHLGIKLLESGGWFPNRCYINS